MARKATKKNSWIVLMERTVRTELVVYGGSEDQVRENPYDFAVVKDRELGETDFTVLSVIPNE